MNVRVDKDKCIGCQTCVVMCEKCFKMNEENVAELVEENDSCDCDLKEVATSCPVEAIEISE